MSRQNRVTPLADITDADWRGSFTGNRGILHGADGTLGVARWRHKAWITCTIRPRPGRAPLPMAASGHYTPLFFTDEAAACAAGHRPCAECRRPAWNAFRAAWARAFGAPARAPRIDTVLHSARTTRDRRQIHHQQIARDLPDGVLILLGDRPHLVQAGAARAWTPAGYGPPAALPAGPVTVLTPAPLVAVMAAGWQPVLDPAQDRAGW